MRRNDVGSQTKKPRGASAGGVTSWRSVLYSHSHTTPHLAPHTHERFNQERSSIERRIRRPPPPLTKPHWRKMVVVSSPFQPPFNTLTMPPGQIPAHSDSWSPRPPSRCRPRPLLCHLLSRSHNHSHLWSQRNLPPTRLPQQPRNPHQVPE